MSTLVVYKTKYGTTETYAKWIGEKLKCQVVERGKVNGSMVEQSENIIVCGPIYGGKVDGIDFFKKYQKVIAEKNLVLVTNGVVDPSIPMNEINMAERNNKALPEGFAEKVEVFHLRGELNYHNLKGGDKSAIKNLKKLVDKQSHKITAEEKEVAAIFERRVDFMNERNVMPVVYHINTLS